VIDNAIESYWNIYKSLKAYKRVRNSRRYVGGAGARWLLFLGSLYYDVDGALDGYLLQVRKSVTLENITTYLALHIHSNKVDNCRDEAERLYRNP
jgi:hypothetical protein